MAAARLVFNRPWTSRFPPILWVLGYLGGAISYLVEKLDHDLRSFKIAVLASTHALKASEEDKFACGSSSLPGKMPSVSAFRPGLLLSTCPTTSFSVALVAALFFAGSGTCLNLNAGVASKLELWSMVTLIWESAVPVKPDSSAMTNAICRMQQFLPGNNACLDRD